MKIAEEEKAIEPITSGLVGYTPVLLQGEREYVRTSETNLADLTTDSMRYVTGADLLEALENGVSLYPEVAGRQLQVSGITIEFDPDAEPMHRITKAEACGASIDPGRTYTVAAIDFLVAGGDGYTSLANGGKNLQYYGADSEALIAYLAINVEDANRVRAAAGQPVQLPGGASESETARRTSISFSQAITSRKSRRCTTRHGGSCGN